MDLEEKFKKETALSSTIPNYINNDGYYSQEYVEWLEQKLTLQGVGCQREQLITFLMKMGDCYGMEKRENAERCVDEIMSN